MVTIDRQFNGPQHSGNGGYVCGLLAGGHGEQTSATVTATLHAPPPLGVPLSWEHDAEETRLLTAGGAVIGRATAGTLEDAPPPAPTAEQSEKGLASYPGFAHHPFDHCFTCGTQRQPGDGLRLFTGPYDDGITAGPWSPHPSFAGGDGRLDLPTTWAALDCPGGWAADFSEVTIVLGRMTAEVRRRPAPGESLRATGLLCSRDGRKFRTATALYTADDELLGRAEQTWILVDPAAFA